MPMSGRSAPVYLCIRLYVVNSDSNRQLCLVVRTRSTPNRLARFRHVLVPWRAHISIITTRAACHDDAFRARFSPNGRKRVGTAVREYIRSTAWASDLQLWSKSIDGWRPTGFVDNYIMPLAPFSCQFRVHTRRASDTPVPSESSDDCSTLPRTRTKPASHARRSSMHAGG
jgi:hypothetical protein